MPEDSGIVSETGADASSASPAQVSPQETLAGESTPPSEPVVSAPADVSVSAPVEVPSPTSTLPASPSEDTGPAVPPSPPVETSTGEVSTGKQNILSSLLAKARSVIQSRKRKKLERIVELARQKGVIGNDDVQKLLRVSDAAATLYLRQLVYEGRLRRVSGRGGTAYEPV